MFKFRLALLLGAACLLPSLAGANQLTNGDLDLTDPLLINGILMNFPRDWDYSGFRTNTGPYEDFLSSETFAGTAPTPVTHDGDGGVDNGVFFKPFTGNVADGFAFAKLSQLAPVEAGSNYVLTGWAGAEANADMTDAVISLDYLDENLNPLFHTEISLMPTLFVSNGQPFNYKQYTLSGQAPAGTACARVQVQMLGGISNPAGGGQAFVVDDFDLEAVPEPSSMAALGLGSILVFRRVRRR